MVVSSVLRYAGFQYAGFFRATPEIRRHTPAFWKIRDFYKSQLDLAYQKLPQDLYSISTIDEFFREMENLILTYIQIQQGSGDKQAPIMDLLARFILLRNSLPDDIFSQTYSEATEKRVLTLIH